MNSLLSILIPSALGLVALLAIGLVIARLYRRAEKDKAYVRTGLGGQKVVLDGGALVLPIFQSLAWVNLQTLRLEVRREHQDAMITKDKMRVDIGVEFYVRVRPNTDAIALAAQTLGNRTNDANQLRDLVEAKFVDALRAVAATMGLGELQEQRAQFVKKVQETVASDLELNGLELESASLTKLDQTDMKYFNPNNAFDAEGLARLTAVTEAKKRERNEIVRTTEVAIAQQDLNAKQQKLELDRQGADAQLNQERDIANKTAATRAEKAQAEATARQSEENARIAADLAIAQRDIEKDRDVSIADQNKHIAVANKSREESEARAEAERARALAVAAEEGVETARRTAIAERDRQVAVVGARQIAEQDAAKITVAAQADREAAENKAAAIRTVAQGEADAEKIRADAKERTYAVDAEGQRRINEARNMLAAPIIEMEVQLARLRIVPEAIAEAVKPLANIGDVKIVDAGGSSGRSIVGGAGGGSPMDSLVTQLLAYRAQSPVVDEILKAAGFTGADPVKALMSVVGGQSTVAPAAETEAHADKSA